MARSRQIATVSLLLAPLGARAAAANTLFQWRTLDPVVYVAYRAEAVQDLRKPAGGA